MQLVIATTPPVPTTQGPSIARMTNASAQRYALFLRGVNVGGVTVKSAELKTSLTEAGFANVRTVLASGNALVTSDLDAQEVKRSAEEAIKHTFDREIPVIVRSQSQVAELVAHSPYDADSESHHAYVVLVESQQDVTTLLGLTPPSEIDESTAAGEHALYWRCPRGSSLDKPASKATTRAAKAILMTTRNVRTLRRLIAD